MAADGFAFDVFLSHSSKDKAVVRRLAERLRGDGLKVWFDQWEIRPGDSIPRKIDEGLEQSAVLVLCMSANSLGSDWAAVESQTFRFTDPVNRELRFIPLRLDETEPRASLRQFAYVDWRGGGSKEAYSRLLNACRLQEGRNARNPEQVVPTPSSKKGRPVLRVLEGHSSSTAVALSADGKRAVSGGGSGDNTVRVWNLEGKALPRLLEGHMGPVWGVALSEDGKWAVSGSADTTLRVWDLGGNAPTRVLKGHKGTIWGVALSADGKRVVSCSEDKTVRVWDLEGNVPSRILEGHTGIVWGVAISADGKCFASCSADKTVRIWFLNGNIPGRVLSGHTDWVRGVALSADGKRAVSCSYDKTVRVWDLDGNAPTRILEGHTQYVRKVALSADGKRAVSCSADDTVRIWDLEGHAQTSVLEGHTNTDWGVALSPDGKRAVSGSDDGTLRIWDIAGYMQQGVAEERTRYPYAIVHELDEAGARVLHPWAWPTSGAADARSQRPMNSSSRARRKSMEVKALQIPAQRGMGIATHSEILGKCGRRWEGR